MLQLSATDLQCVQIYLGGCHDGGYKTFLDQCKQSKEIMSKITLLGHHSLLFMYRQLKFRIINLSDIFDSQPSLTEAAATSYSSPSTPPPLKSPPSVVSEPITQLPNEVTKQDRQTYKPTCKPQSREKASDMRRTRSTTVGSVLLNAGHKRLDIIKRVDEQDSKQLKMKTSDFGEHCYQYFLNGRCTNNSCEHYHSGALSAGEKVALERKARKSRCFKGSACTRHDCFFGHHCPNDACIDPDCRFRDRHRPDVASTGSCTDPNCGHGDLHLTDLVRP